MIGRPSIGSHLRLIVLGATTVLLSVAILQTFSPSAFTQQALTSSKPGTRSVVVNVFDARGNSIRDLTKENFHVLVNGKPTPVFDARYSVAPRRIVVLLDLSGSMTGDKTTGKWRIVREAVSDLLVKTPSDMPIAMLTFAGKVREVFEFSQGRNAIAKWLSEGPGQDPELGYPARTALFDSILAALQLLQPTQPGDALYVITDGGEDSSLASAVRTKKALLQSCVRMFTLLFAEPLKVPDEQEAQTSFLSMVQDSGGFAFGLSGHLRVGQALLESIHTYQDESRDKVKAYTQQLAIQVNGFWTLEVAAPFSSNGQSKIKLEVVSNEGKARKDIVVTYYRVLQSLNIPSPERALKDGSSY